MKAVRVPVPYPWKDYAKYREYTRKSFSFTCTYCMLHENELAGEAGFDQDHYHPTSKGGPESNYDNLYWSCSECNQDFKRATWPSPAQRAKGYEFWDPIKFDPIGHDYVEPPNSVLLTPVTPQGHYTIAHLALNIRPFLLRKRQSRLDVFKSHAFMLQRLKNDRVQIAAKSAYPSQGAILTLLDRVIQSYERILAKKPFMLDEDPIPLSPQLSVALGELG